MDKYFLKDLYYGNYQPSKTLDKNKEAQALFNQVEALKNKLYDVVDKDSSILIAELSDAYDELLDIHTAASYEEGIHFAANFLMAALTLERTEDEK